MWCHPPAAFASPTRTITGPSAGGRYTSSESRPPLKSSSRARVRPSGDRRTTVVSASDPMAAATVRTTRSRPARASTRYRSTSPLFASWPLTVAGVAIVVADAGSSFGSCSTSSRSIPTHSATKLLVPSGVCRRNPWRPGLTAAPAVTVSLTRAFSALSWMTAPVSPGIRVRMSGPRSSKPSMLAVRLSSEKSTLSAPARLAPSTVKVAVVARWMPYGAIENTTGGRVCAPAASGIITSPAAAANPLVIVVPPRACPPWNAGRQSDRRGAGPRPSRTASRCRRTGLRPACGRRG